MQMYIFSDTVQIDAVRFSGLWGKGLGCFYSVTAQMKSFIDGMKHVYGNMKKIDHILFSFLCRYWKISKQTP